MTWVYAIPLWLFAIGAIGIITALSAAGLLYTRRVFPHRDEITHNDVAASVVATLGTILAVVLSFMVVTVWQEYDGAAGTVQNEVDAICNAYHDASTLPQPAKGLVQSHLAKYVNTVINVEWPLMRRGAESAEAHYEAFVILKLVTGYKPSNSTQLAVQTDMIVQSHAINDARRERLFDNRQSIPHILWWMLLFISAITISSAYVFRVRNGQVHLLLTSALAAVIAAILVLIAQFDLPFRGDIQVQPTAFDHALQAISDDPPTSGYSPNVPKSDRR